MGRFYTEEHHAWLAEHYADMTNKELAEAFNQRFGTDHMTPPRAQNYGNQHGLRKSRDAFCRRTRRYTDEQREWLREYIPVHSTTEIIEAFEERFGIRLSKAMVSNQKVRLGVRSGTQGGTFKKGHTPYNKGKTWDEIGYSQEKRDRMLSTAFKKGQVPHNAYHELLDERTDEYGTWVYVRPRNRRFSADDWVGKQRFVWMQHNGCDWPEGCQAVFADRDRANFDPDNIVPVPMEIYGMVTGNANGHCLRWHDRESLETAMLHATVIRERHKLEMYPRECGSCHETFTPEYPQQMTCRKCLDAGRRAPRRRRKTNEAAV